MRFNNNIHLQHYFMYNSNSNDLMVVIILLLLIVMANDNNDNNNRGRVGPMGRRAYTERADSLCHRDF